MKSVLSASWQPHSKEEVRSLETAASRKSLRPIFWDDVDTKRALQEVSSGSMTIRRVAIEYLKLCQGTELSSSGLQEWCTDVFISRREEIISSFLDWKCRD